MTEALKEDRPLIVALGASAGGLEPLEEFFQKMPSNSGISFIIIQHLSPDYKSLMDEILGRITTMKINRVEDSMPVEADQIYLIPAKKEMVIAKGRLKLRDKDVTEQLSMPIDIFLHALAEDGGKDAVAIILSGSGSDGSRGVKAVQKHGGLVIAQDPATAKFNSMPQSTITSGAVDLILAVDEIPAALLNYQRDTNSRKQPEREGYKIGEELSEIFAMLHERHQIDFSAYKKGTIVRRIERRMSILKANSIRLYLTLLQKDEGELNALFKDLLIGVTAFFRDPEAYSVLQQIVIPDLVKNHPKGEELRVWIVGCATGEEAYSMAICFAETMRTLNSQVNLKIFATDVHQESINSAAAGIYEKPRLAELSGEITRRWFEKTDGQRYQINPELRRMIVFAEHDVLKDPPFTKISLLSCRNLLIYMQPAAQRKILSMFHFSMIKGARLFLGPSETLSDLEGEFETIDKSWKIYQKTRDIKLPANLHFPLASTLGTSTLTSTRPTAASLQVNQRLLRAYDSVLENHIPSGVIINEAHELIHTFGNTRDLLKPPRGRASLDILNMVEDELKIALAAALQRAERERISISYKGIGSNMFANSSQVSVRVDPLPDKISGSFYFFVVFTPEIELLDDGEKGRDFDVGAESTRRITDLEAEVVNLRENLQNTVEELETSNEELQASNEELVASNEELQSTNEELHSVNEELYTVNSEYKFKIDELTNVTNDMENLFNSTDFGTLFLDQELKIRKYTTPITKVFNIISQDIGRPVEHISHLLKIKTLKVKMKTVLHSGLAHEQELQTEEGAWYLLKILPYIDDLKRISGLVITTINITERRLAMDKARQLAAIASDSLDAIIVLAPDHTIVSWSKGAERMYGLQEKEAIGGSYRKLVPTEKLAELDELLLQVRDGEMAETLESIRLKSDGSRIDVWLTITPIKNRAGEIQLLSIIERDITPIKLAEIERIKLTEQLHHANKMQAVGTLAGGVAHEFNNLVQAISGQVEYLFLNKKIVTEEGLVLSDIKTMTQRAKELVQGMLTFSRQVDERRNDIDLNVIIEDTTRLLVKTYPKDIKIHMDLTDKPLTIAADKGQIQQVLLNLANNAKDAMANGGDLSFTSRLTTIKTICHLHHLNLDPGTYAEVEVRDTGIGMEKEVVRQIFTPFYTTKGIGDGTGLGLSIVYGTITSHNGGIKCISKPGKGTVFHLYLPLARAGPQPATPWQDQKTPAPKPPKEISQETILIVDDEKQIRKFTTRILEKAGYQILNAASGEEALVKVRENQGQIDCVVLDMGMPGMGGEKCLVKMLEIDSGLRVIIASGYLDHPWAAAPRSCGAKAFLAKPYEVSALAASIQAVIKSS